MVDDSNQKNFYLNLCEFGKSISGIRANLVDLGIRNTIIDNYNNLEFRDDHGKLWENFIISERKKYLSYTMNFKNCYFWRTYTGAELDYVEEGSGKLSGFEIKWSARNRKAPASWLSTYKKATFKEINNMNFIDFISDISA